MDQSFEVYIKLEEVHDEVVKALENHLESNQTKCCNTVSLVGRNKLERIE